MLTLAIGLGRLGGPPRGLGRSHPCAGRVHVRLRHQDIRPGGRDPRPACRTTASARSRSSFRSSASISARTSPHRTQAPMLTASRVIRPETSDTISTRCEGSTIAGWSILGVAADSCASARSRACSPSSAGRGEWIAAEGPESAGDRRSLSPTLTVLENAVTRISDVAVNVIVAPSARRSRRACESAWPGGLLERWRATGRFR